MDPCFIFENLCFRVKVTFIKASGERITAKGKIGDTLLDVIVNNSLDFDGYGKNNVCLLYTSRCV